jgi:hypothetical protein
MAEHVGNRPAVGDLATQVVIRQPGDQAAQALALAGVAFA